MTPGRHVDPDRPADGPRPEQADRPAEGRPAGHRQRQVTASDGAPVVPSRSADDLDTGWGERPGSGDDDERFLRDVPPHW